MPIPLAQALACPHRDWARRKVLFPTRGQGKPTKAVPIIPCEAARFFTGQFVEEVHEKPQAGPPESAWAMCVKGSSFPIDGKSLKSINHGYNQRMAQWQSMLDRQKLPRSEEIARIPMRRHHRVHDDLLKAARYIIRYAPHRDCHGGR
ncbi:MAG: hypothetical protein M0Z53_14670 [Thermaerobacter sp.]|nr:hypothetical protein [Thermaerobacter sp.]